MFRAGLPISGSKNLVKYSPLLESIKCLKYSQSTRQTRPNSTAPSVIHGQKLPIAMSEQNMICVAETGLRKTLAYVLPAIAHRVEQEPPEPINGPMALVLVSSKELGQQIQAVVHEYRTGRRIDSVCLFGAMKNVSQMSELIRRVELLITTPEPLLDLLNTEEKNILQISYVVLNEADKICETGFEPQIREVLKQLRPNPQVLMWSATWSKEVRQLAQDFFGDYSQFDVHSLRFCSNLESAEIIEFDDEKDKKKKFFESLRKLNPIKHKRVIIFEKSKRIIIKNDQSSSP